MQLPLSKIVTTAGTQIRATIDSDTVEQYAELMRDDAAKLPPVVVFHDGSQFILADGFHRVMAASRNGFTDIEAEVWKGTRTDALKYALGANSTHGLKRTNSDKRRSVELALAEWPKLSDREIARVCAVGATLVADVRGVNCNNNAVETRTGADGKKRRRPKRKPTPPRTEPEPEQPKDEPSSPSHTPADEAVPQWVSPETARKYFATKAEDLCTEAFEFGSIEQLQIFGISLESNARKCKALINKRRTDAVTQSE